MLPEIKKIKKIKKRGHGGKRAGAGRPVGSFTGISTAEVRRRVERLKIRLANTFGPAEAAAMLRKAADELENGNP